MTGLLYAIILIYGLLFGSFLNVLIYRIPLKEEFVKTRSHCMSCGYQLRWYDLVPVISYVCLGGKCRKCKQKISIQYPLIEMLNGGLYLTIALVHGICIESLLYCALTSALITLSVIDFRTFEIPLGINVFILTLGLIHLAVDYTNWTNYVIGLLCVSMFLYLIYLITNGRGIGGGDIKLMAACGLLIGWKNIILAFILGCIIGSIVHLIRMRVTKADHVLAMGPYLSVGVFLAALWGDQMIQWYLGFFVIQ